MCADQLLIFGLEGSEVEGVGGVEVGVIQALR